MYCFRFCFHFSLIISTKEDAVDHFHIPNKNTPSLSLTFGSVEGQHDDAQEEAVFATFTDDIVLVRKTRFAVYPRYVW